jgi:hypothetical protein
MLVLRDNGATTAAITLAIDRALAGQLAAAVSFLGEFVVDTSLDGEIAADIALLGGVDVDSPLGGQLSAEVSLQGTVVVDTSLGGTVAALVVFAADLALIEAFEGFEASLVEVVGRGSVVTVEGDPSLVTVEPLEGKMSDWSIKEGCTRPALDRVLKHNGRPLDLSEASGVTFRWKLKGGAVREKAAEIVDGSQGRVRVRFDAEDTSPPGTYACEFLVVFDDDSEQVGPSSGWFEIDVEKRL